MGCKLQEFRERKGMTQSQLAEKSGVSRGTISAMENGTMRAAMSSTLIKLARALGATVEQIFFADDV